MRILFVSHSAGLYGAERALLELVKGLKSRGVECLVTIPRPGGLFYALRDADIPVVIVPYSWWVDRPRDFWKRPGRWLLSLVGLPWLVKLTARWRPDIVYTNTLAVWIGAVAAWIGGLPHIWHVHEFVEEDLVFHLGRLLSLKLVDVLSEKVIANSETVAQRLKKYIQEGRIDSTLEDVLKKVEENFEKHKERKILIVLKPDEEKVKEITRIIEEGGKSKEKIICILCSKKEYVYSPNEISKVFPWLVSPDKNITFVYNHSENKYHENLPICYKCAEALRGSKYLDIDFKFLDCNFRIFPEITIEDYNMVKNTWDYLTTKLGECFDDVVKELPSEKLKPEFIWLNIWIYRKEMNKLNIIDQIENIRLIDLIEMYRIFEAWRKKKGIDEKIVDKNSLLNVIIQNEGKIQLHLDLALQILNKLLRKEKIDNNIQVRVLNIFNKLSQKYFHKENKKELQRFIKFVDFIEFYNKNLNI